MCENFGFYETGLEENVQKVKKALNVFALISTIIGFGYLVFWSGAINDSYFMELGEGIFKPIANMLYPFDNSVDVYRNTGFTLIFAIIPVIIINSILDSIKNMLIKNDIKKENALIEKERKEAKENYMARFDGIRMYSICLSLDYESKKEISEENKLKLHKSIFSKIKTTLKLVDTESFISQSDVLIFSSSNFKKYDQVYDKLLSILPEYQKMLTE